MATTGAIVGGAGGAVVAGGGVAAGTVTLGGVVTGLLPLVGAGAVGLLGNNNYYDNKC